MKLLKRFILRLLLTKQERVTIWNALWFSNHTYRRRGNVDGAAAVQMVMNRIGGLLVPKVRKYSEKELVEIVEGVINQAAKTSEGVTRHIASQEFNKGYWKGRSERTLEEIAKPIRPFGRRAVHVVEKDGKLEVVLDGSTLKEIDREKCETCDSCEGCIVFAMIFGHDKGEDAKGSDSKPTEGEDTEKEEKNEEQSPECVEGHHETPKEDEGK